MRRQILVLGYFGYMTNQLDGQTIKTRNIYNLLKMKGYNVTSYDTQNFKYNKWSIVRMLYLIFCCRVLVYIPAHNNLKYIFPAIYLISLICNIKIHYFVVGGWLAEYLKGLPIHRVLLRKIQGIYPETQRLKDQLEHKYGFQNIRIFPNFRITDFQPLSCVDQNRKLKVVFMARINMMKGLGMVDKLCQYITNNKLHKDITITFYGPIASTDEDYFLNIIKTYRFVEYAGVLQPNSIYDTLQHYDVMILPTRYYTEGIPGSILDAYISGIPVIATHWKHATEIIDNYKTGIIVPFHDGQEQFNIAITNLKNDVNMLSNMKTKSLAKGQHFKHHHASAILSELINSNDL